MIWRKVPFSPALDPMVLLRRPNDALPPPLDAPTTRMYPYGRVALLQGLRLLAIRPGDNVLVPSFICASVISPFNKLHIRVRYYEVDDQLQPKFDTAIQGLDSKTRAFLGVHYFGFAQDVKSIRDFCEDHGLYYIEDNAHGFLSAVGYRPLGTFGDIAIFSQRKTLALPNGGALVVNRPDLLIRSELKSNRLPVYSKASTLKFLVRHLALNLDYHLLDYYFTSILPRLGRPKHAGAEKRDEEKNLDDYLEAYSKLASWILFRAHFEKEKNVRRRSFLFWSSVFRTWSAQQVSPVFEGLPEGTVPWVFPIRVRQRKEFVDELKRRGIECYPWPILPSAAKRTPLSEEIALVPLHRYPAFVDERLIKSNA